MNLKTMVARVMRATPVLPPGRLGEQDVVDMLNHAQLHLSRISSKVIMSEFELDADYNIVPFPTDILTLSAVYWSSGAGERELIPSPMRLNDTTGEPRYYYAKGSRLYLYPTPARSGTVTTSYVPVPTTMVADDDTPDIENSENYLIAFALQRIHLEANSPLFQVWDMEKAKEEYTFTQTTEQNYRTPFRVEAQW